MPSCVNKRRFYILIEFGGSILITEHSVHMKKLSYGPDLYLKYQSGLENQFLSYEKKLSIRLDVMAISKYDIFSVPLCLEI